MPYIPLTRTPWNKLPLWFKVLVILFFIFAMNQGISATEAVPEMYESYATFLRIALWTGLGGAVLLEFLSRRNS